MFTILDGYKTTIAGTLAIVTGIAMVLTGVAGMIATVVDSTSPYAMDLGKAWTSITTGLATISGGVGVLGIGHKLEKNTAAVKSVKKEGKDIKEAVEDATTAIEAGQSSS